MCKFKMKLLYLEETFALKQLLNFNITLPLAELDMVSSRLVSNGLIFWVEIVVDIQFIIFLLLSNVSELRIGAKTRKF